MLTWEDLADLSAVVPLLARVYPNGSADINHFHAAGGVAFLVHTLLGAGLLHDDVRTIMGRGLWRYTTEPRCGWGTASSRWEEGPKASRDLDVLRPAEDPFAADGGLRVLRGPLGTAVIKTSAVTPEHRVVTAPARGLRRPGRAAAPRSTTASSTAATSSPSSATRARRPTACPSCTSSPRPSGCCRTAASRVAIVTDGRMSGASGKVPAAIHVTPEAALGGPLARVRDGDVITRRRRARPAGVVDSAEALRRAGRPAAPTRGGEEWAGTGRELFAGFRATVGAADTGASVFPTGQLTRQEVPRCPARLRPCRVTAGSLLDLAPVVPVVVVHDVATAVPRRAGAGRRRRAGDRADPAHAGRARGDPRHRRRGARDPSSAPAPSLGAAPGRRGPGRRGAVPRLARGDADPARRRLGTRGCRSCPGTATVSEALAVLEAGVTEMKFFPAEASGGSGVPEGPGLPGARRPASARPAGSRPATAASYLALPNVGCVGGTWLTPADAIATGDWDRVSRLAAETLALRTGG